MHSRWTHKKVHGHCAGGQAGNALEMVMRIWTERQIELRGVYEINLTSTALAALLASGHPALAEAQARSPPSDTLSAENFM